MGTCPDSIKRLIDRFEHQADQLRSPDYNDRGDLFGDAGPQEVKYGQGR